MEASKDEQTRCCPTSQRKRVFCFLPLWDNLPIVALCQKITLKRAPVARRPSGFGSKHGTKKTVGKKKNEQKLRSPMAFILTHSQVITLKRVPVATGNFTHRSQQQANLPECTAPSTLQAVFVQYLSTYVSLQLNAIGHSHPRSEDSNLSVLGHGHPCTFQGFQTRARQKSHDLPKKGTAYQGHLPNFHLSKGNFATGIFTQRSQQQANLSECKVSSILLAALGCIQNANAFKEVLSSN